MHSIDGFFAKYGSFQFRNDWSSDKNLRKRSNTTAPPGQGSTEGLISYPDLTLFYTEITEGLHPWHNLMGTRLIEARMTSLCFSAMLFYK